MKTYILAALLGTLTYDQVHSLKVNQKKPDWVEDQEARSWRDTENENKIVDNKYKNFTNDIAAGMKRDNVWTNGTKARISGGKSASGGGKSSDGGFTDAEQWTRNMPSHIPDDIKGPTTSRTAAPAIDGIEREYKFDNVTSSGPSAKQIADESEPKKVVSKKESTKATEASGVDIDAGVKQQERAKEEKKAEAKAAKAEAAKSKAESDA